jgi:hypothetical protein
MSNLATSTLNNPGAFAPPRPKGPRAIAATAARAVAAGRYRQAAVGVAVDSVNWLEAHADRRLSPRFRCTCCGHTAHAFRHHVARDRIAWHSACPRCDSRSRHRGLAVLLPRLVAAEAPARVLHFAPEPVLRPCFEVVGGGYETADLFLDDVTHKGVDLGALPFADRSYDLAVCNHVLEHLVSDEPALAELSRVAVTTVITVPGEFSRQTTQSFVGELVNGHYRDYGLDFVDRLRAHFASVEVHDLHDFDRDDSGLSRAIRRLDLAFVCRASRPPRAGPD